MQTSVFRETADSPFIIGKGECYKDRRGSFTPLRALEGTLQCNVSVSVPNTVRGVHYQKESPQAKLITCLTGKIHDVCLDIRPESPSFGKTFEFELEEGTGSQLFVPKGFAHGFEVVGDRPATILYMVASPYAPGDERGYLWSSVPVVWLTKPEDAVLSDKDKLLPPFPGARSAGPETAGPA